MEQTIKEELEMKEQIKEEMKDPEKLLCPKAGTATSSPNDLTAFQSELNIPNAAIWMQRNARA